MGRRKPKSRQPRPRYQPTTWDRIALAFELLCEITMRLPWPIKILLIALPVAAYFVYPYYEDWRTWDEEFHTQVYNMSDERMGLFSSTQHDQEVRIGAGWARPNSDAEQRNDYTNKRTVTFVWNFSTRDQGRTDISTGLDGGMRCEQVNGKEICKRQWIKVPILCYYKTIELPPRKRGMNYLYIGIYGQDVLRIRWGSEGFFTSKIRDGKYVAAEAWRYGAIPLSSNWFKDDATGWPQKPEWNEAIDGPRIDALGNTAWITAKADYSKPCEEK